MEVAVADRRALGSSCDGDGVVAVPLSVLVPTYVAALLLVPVLLLCRRFSSHRQPHLSACYAVCPLTPRI